MNSYEILKNLRRLLNDRKIDQRSREIIQTAVNHIVLQDDEILELREDITDVSIPQV
jgi:hypothetical protein